MSPQQIRDAIAASSELQALGGDTQAMATEPDPITHTQVGAALAGAQA